VLTSSFLLKTFLLSSKSKNLIVNFCSTRPHFPYGKCQTEDRTHSERDNGKEEELSTSERPLKTSELANEENEGVFESNRKSQDEGHSSLNSSTFPQWRPSCRARSSKARKSTWNDLDIDRRRQKISTVTLLQTDSTPLGRPKSTYSTRLAGLVGRHWGWVLGEKMF